MAKGKYKGKPTQSIIPKGVKAPRSLGPMAERGYPRVCFRHFDAATQWGDKEHHSASFAAIVKKLSDYETMPWAEIAKKDHYDPIEELCKRARDRLTELAMDEHDRLFRFQFKGLERLWGIRDADDNFLVIWWDPRHEVRPYSLQNRDSNSAG